MILASIWRDSVSYIDRYVRQVQALRALGVAVRVIAVEGDSADHTWDELQTTDFLVLKCEHGGRRYGPVDDALRWRQLACACNVAITAADRLCDGQPVVYVESDLIWDADTMLTLVKHLETYPAVAPMSFHLGSDTFYDTWGHIRNGVSFRADAPYYDGWAPDQMVSIDSAGSCFALRGDVVSSVAFSPLDCIRGIGRSLRDAGHTLWLDPSLRVSHP